MIINKARWFSKDNRGYSQVEERLYFLENATLTRDERKYELSVIERLVGMMPDSQSRIIYSHKLRYISGGSNQ